MNEQKSSYAQLFFCKFFHVHMVVKVKLGSMSLPLWSFPFYFVDELLTICNHNKFNNKLMYFLKFWSTFNTKKPLCLKIGGMQ
jgi:hypothetical protein